MKKKYTLKFWLQLSFILLFSCVAIGQRTNTVSLNASRQSAETTSSILVCDIDQSSFNFSDTSNSTTFGQSFTAQCSSNIASVSLAIGSTLPTTSVAANIYLGETVSGTSLGSVTLASVITGENVFVFNTPIAITSGQQYSVIFTSITDFTVPYSDLDPYTDGKSTDGFSFFLVEDLVFKITTCDTPVTPTFTPIAAICAGDSLTLPTTSDNSITGTWSPAVDNTTTTTYTFTPDTGQCATTTTLSVTVNIPPQNTVSIIACDTYIWSVNGTTYTTSGSYSETVNCVMETLNLSIIPTQTVAIATPDLACEDSTLTLTATTSTAQINDFEGVFDISLWTLSNTNANGNVNTTGAPTSISLTSGNNSSANPGDTNYTFTAPFTGTITFDWQYSSLDDSDADIPNLLIDGNPTLLTGFNTLGSDNQSGSMTVNVTAGQVIGFNMHTIDNIFGTGTVVISNFTAIVTPQLQWVATSGGTIVGGSDQLSVDVTTSGTYTLTNTIGTCSASDFVAITFNPNEIPTFTQVDPICSGDALAALPTTSDNGITGIWSPAMNNSITTLYTFTPDSGQCATTATMTISVTQRTSNATTLSDCDSYTWAENGTTYTTSGTYTSETGCHTEILNLTIIPIQTIDIAPPASLCEGATLTLTATTSTVQINNFTEDFDIVNWSLTNIDANGSVNTTGAPTSISLTGGNNGSVDAGNTNYTITMPTSGTISFDWNYTTNDDPDFDYPNVLINGNPTLLTGFDTSGSTTQSGSMTVNVLAGQTFSFNMYTDDNLFGAATVVITNFTADIMPQLQWVATNGGTIVGANNQLNVTVSTSGTYTIFGSNGICPAFFDSVAVTFNPNLTPTFTQVTPICDGDILTALPTLSNNGYTGTWSPALDNTTTTLYTFTPNVGECATTTTMTITVIPNTSNTTTLTICDTYTWAENGTIYTSSGIYSNVVNCHTEILDLTIIQSTSNTTVVSVCDTYTWAENGTTYTSSGIFSEVTGCHTEILDLTITPSTSNTTTLTICDTYTWAENGTTYTSSGIFSSLVNCHTEILDLTIIPSTSNTTTLSVCDTYTWTENGTTYTSSGIFSSVTGCHTEILDLTVTPSTSNTTVVSVCDTYTWAENGTTYTSSGIFSEVTGCHTEFLDLTITPSTSNTTIVSVCDTYTWAENGTTYTASGIFSNVVNCHTEILDLTITPSTSNTTTVSVCDTYTWAENGTTYTSSGIFSSVTGCHTEILDLTITPSTSNTTTVSVCDTYTWTENGTTYTSSGIFSVVTGCHTEILDLTITPSTSNTTTLSVCDTYTWVENGTTYTASGIFSVVTGCHTEILDLTITPSTSNTTTLSVCDTYTWAENGTTYTASGIFSNVVNCHTEILDLTITPNTSNTTTESVCDTYTWAENGTTYTSSGIFSEVTGCHTEILNLTITPTTSNTTTLSVCDTYTWAENGTTYTSSGVFSVVTGCHTEILDLTITPSTSNTTTVSVCDTYTWTENGTTYTSSGIFSVVTGCHTELLDLTITPTTSNTTTLSVCDTYTWAENGTTYTSSGIFSEVTGCHTEILDLTITPSTSNTTTVSVCDTYTWAENGTTYTSSGIFSVVTGCHTELLDLTITPTTSNTTTVSVCDTYTWAENGTTYTTSGIFSVVTGCHTEILDLTITPSTSNTTTLTECGGYTWAENGTTYTSSGIFSAVTGCHTEILDLTITPGTTNTTTVAVCDTYTWAENGTTYTSSGIFSSIVNCHAEILDLTITPSTSNTTTIAVCDTYTWAENGTTYTSSGTFSSVTGCHTEILDLTINSASAPTGNATQTFSVTDVNNATLASIVVSPTNVIWYGSLSDAQSETNPLAMNTVLTTGATYYAVNVVGACSSTPLAVTVTVALGNEHFDTVNFSFYPNPTESILNIKYSKEISSVSVYNLLGQILMSEKTNATEVQINLLNLPTETYFVKVVSEGIEKVIKVMKK